MRSLPLADTQTFTDCLQLQGPGMHARGAGTGHIRCKCPHRFTIALPNPLQVNRIRPFTMPLMSIAATAIDQPQSREAVIASMLQYLHTDSVICRAEAGKLAEAQAKVWGV
jgi:hypothetical protein